jgi:hypothetical protein
MAIDEEEQVDGEVVHVRQFTIHLSSLSTGQPNVASFSAIQYNKGDAFIQQTQRIILSAITHQ